MTENRLRSIFVVAFFVVTTTAAGVYFWHVYMDTWRINCCS